MKIEMGESLMQSYFRYVEKCLVTQTNWKTASVWKIDNEKIKDVFEKIKKHPVFCDVFNKSSLDQALKQAELDIIGISGDSIYMAEVAFHENGLQYGDKNKTKDRVCKKLLRAYLCGLAFFPKYSYKILFASPKVHNATDEIITKYFSVLNKDFSEEGKVEFSYIANESFKQKILMPTLKASTNDSDTSELFLRSAKMLELFGLVNLNDADATKEKKVAVKAHAAENGKKKASTISKSDAIKLCRKNGFANSGEITFSSTNNGNGVFWANPNIELLSEDWWLVLNDKEKEKEKLYVLFIPGNSININELLVRADKTWQIDLQIKNDDSFVDSRSKYSFKKYLKTTIKY